MAKGSQAEKNQWLIDLKGPAWAKNMADNRAAYRARGRPLEVIFGTHEQQPMLLLGPGPSLDLVVPMIGHTYTPMPVMTCNSALNPLAARGIVPRFIVVLDAEPKIADQIREFVAFVPEEHRKNSLLIAAATACPAVIDNWPHEFVLFAQLEETTPVSKKFFETLVAQYADPDNPDPLKRAITALRNVSCVFNTMVQIAAFMGAVPVFACGFELSVEEDVNYAATRFDLSTDPPRPTTDQIRDMDWRMVRVHRGYVSTLLNIIQGEGAFFINLSPLASFRELVMTLPPNTLLTGEMRVPGELADNGAKRDNDSRRAVHDSGGAQSRPGRNCVGGRLQDRRQDRRARPARRGANRPGGKSGQATR